MHNDSKSGKKAVAVCDLDHFRRCELDPGIGVHEICQNSAGKPLK